METAFERRGGEPAPLPSRIPGWSRAIRASVGLALVVSAVLLLVGNLLALRRPQQVELLVGAGPDGSRGESPYALLSGHLVDSLRDRFQGTPVEILEGRTVGSLDTLRQIDVEGRHRVGIVQADVLWHYVRGGHPQLPVARDGSGVRAVARVFTEWVHLWVDPAAAGTRCDPEADRADCDEWWQTRGTVCGGVLGSGSLVTTLQVARVLDTRWTAHHSCSEPEVVLAVRSPGSGAAPEAAGLHPIWFEPSAARVLEAASPVYRFTQVSREESDPRATIEMDALLVADRSVSPRVIGAIIDLLTELDERACPDLPGSGAARGGLLSRSTYCATGEAREASRFDDLPIAGHPAIVVERLPPISRLVVLASNLRLLRSLLLAALGAMFLFLAWTGRSGLVISGATGSGLLRFLNTRRRLLTAAAALVLFHLTIGVLVWISELRSESMLSDPSFVTEGIREALLWMWRFSVMEEGIRPLHSKGALFWIGVLKGTWLALTVGISLAVGRGSIRWLRRGRIVGHVVLVGWNARGPSVASELRNQGRPYRVVALRDGVSERDVGREAVERVESLSEGLDAVSYDLAEAAIVLSDADQAQIDGESDVDLWVCKQVARLRARDERERGTEAGTAHHVVAEIIRHGNVDFAYRSGADEVVCVHSFGVGLLAQAATKPRLSALFANLLGTADNSQEVYFDPISSEERVRYGRFEQIAAAMWSEAVPRGQRRVAVGLLRAAREGQEEGVLLNPEGSDAVLQEGDALIVLADNPKGQQA